MLTKNLTLDDKAINPHLIVLRTIVEKGIALIDTKEASFLEAKCLVERKSFESRFKNPNFHKERYIPTEKGRQVYNTIFGYE